MREWISSGSRSVTRLCAVSFSRVIRAPSAGFRLLVALILAILAAAPAAAQQRIRAGQAVGVTEPEPKDARFEPARDRDAEAWLRKALDARRNENWKLLIDTLQRVVRDHGAGFVATDLSDAPGADTLISARALAWRILHEAGPAAQEAYRLTYSADAELALGDAAETDDAQRLRRVAAQFLPTDAGLRAADRLTTLLLDSGRWLEALHTMDQRIAFAPGDEPKWPTMLRRCVVHAALKQQMQAARILDQLERIAADEEMPGASSRIAELRRIVDDPSRIVPTFLRNNWPALLGSTRDLGQMDGIDPRVIGFSPLRLTLPGAAHVDRRRAQVEAFERSRAPVWQAVTDGRSLFVTTPTGFAALDPITLEPRWEPVQSGIKAARQAPRTPQAGFPRQPRQRNVDRRGKLDLASARAVFDESAGTIALIDGTIFVVEQPVLSNDDSGLGADDFTYLVENSLCAYSAATGKLLWMRGRSGPPEDGLTGAHFFCPPVAAGRYLIAPYQLGGELALLALERDGRIAGSVELGTGSDNTFPFGRVVPIAVADDELYVPTGMGYVFSLSISDFSLRWALPYDRALRQRTTRMQNAPNLTMIAEPIPDAWLNSPPLVCDDLLIVAPVDSDELLAIDRWSGAMRWHARRDGLRYLIGSDGELVFAYGRELAAFPLRSAQGTLVLPRWRLEGPGIAGRPVLAGTNLFVPTNSGLMVLEARTGNRLVVDESRELGALGNLMVWNGALYSLEHDALRRFSDSSRELKDAQGRLAESPIDPQRRLDVARLQLRGKQFGAALATLDEFATMHSAHSDVDSAEAVDAERLRLRALMGLATAGTEAAADWPAIDSLRARLVSAADKAAQAADRVAASRTIAELDLDRDQPTTAFSVLLAALEPRDAAPIAMDFQRSVSSDLALSEDLRRIWSRLTPPQRDGTAKLMQEMLDRAEKSDDVSQAVRLADALHFAPGGADLDLQIAARQEAMGRPESAAYHLRRAAAQTDSRDAAARAQQRLKELKPHAEPAPGDAIEPDESSAPPVPEGAPVARFRRLGRTALDDFLVGASPIPVHSSDESPSIPASLILVGEQSIKLFDPRRMPEQAVRLSIPIEEPVRTGDPRSPATDEPQRPLGTAVVAGDIAAVPTLTGIEFIGLRTGVPVTRPILYAPEIRDETPIQPVAAARDMFVAALNARTLVGIPARHDATPLWRLTLDAPEINVLRTAEDLVIAATPGCTRLWVIDPQTGRIRRAQTEDGDDAAVDRWPANSPQRAACLVGACVAMVQDERIRVRHIPSGQVVWQAELPGEVSDVRALGDSFVGVTSKDTFSVYAIQTGDLVGRIDSTLITLPPLGATLTPGGQLILAHASSQPPGRIQLSWFNLASGRSLASAGPWPLATLTNLMLTGPGSLLPVVRYDPAANLGGVETVGFDENAATLMLYDRATGAPHIHATELTEGGSDGGAPVRRVVNAFVSDQVVIVLTDTDALFYGPLEGGSR